MGVEVDVDVDVDVEVEVEVEVAVVDVEVEVDDVEVGLDADERWADGEDGELVAPGEAACACTDHPNDTTTVMATAIVGIQPRRRIRIVPPRSRSDPHPIGRLCADRRPW